VGHTPWRPQRGRRLRLRLEAGTEREAGSHGIGDESQRDCRSGRGQGCRGHAASDARSQLSCPVPSRSQRQGGWDAGCDLRAVVGALPEAAREEGYGLGEPHLEPLLQLFGRADGLASSRGQVDDHLLSHQGRHLRVMDELGSVGYQPGSQCLQSPGDALIAFGDEGLPSHFRYKAVGLSQVPSTPTQGYPSHYLYYGRWRGPVPDCAVTISSA
jgi:hypothetical protein